MQDAFSKGLENALSTDKRLNKELTLLWWTDYLFQMLRATELSQPQDVSSQKVQRVVESDLAPIFQIKVDQFPALNDYYTKLTLQYYLNVLKDPNLLRGYLK